MPREPLVSVLINNYNYADYLADAIDSALAQGWSHTEVVVVDDGSTDRSRDIIAGYGGRIRAVLQPNGGQAAAFNAGVAASRGEILCFLDSDDVWAPDKVERVVHAFERFPEAAWLRHLLRVSDADKRPQQATMPQFRGTRLRRPIALEFVEGCFPVPTSTLVIRRSLAERIFPLPVVTPRNGRFAGVDLKHDADAYLALRAASTGEPFLSLDEELGLYRRHPKQRYVSVEDIEPILQRQIMVAAGVASALAEQLGAEVVPSSVYKHQAILAALHGRPLLHRDRIKPLIGGVRRVLPLARVSPRLFARQSLALGFGTLLPRVWIRRLMREQGFLSGSVAT